MTLGQRILQQRKSLGLSQEELADRVGVSRQAVSKWELDEAQPDASKIILLAQALGVTTDQLLLGDQTDPQGPGEDPLGSSQGPGQVPPESSQGPGEDPAWSSQGPGEDPAWEEPSAYVQVDRFGPLTRFLQKHGYKAGYVLMAWGAVLLLVSGIMFFAIHTFFSAVNSQSEDFSHMNPGGLFINPGSLGGVEFSLAPGVSLTPREEQAILDQINGVHHPEPEHGGEHH